MKVDPLTYSTTEAADALGVSEKFLRESLIPAGLPHVRIGRVLMFPRLAVSKWINETAITSNPITDGQDGSHPQRK